MFKFTITIALFIFFINIYAGQTQKIYVGNFSKGSLKGWYSKVFDRKTSYKITEMDNKKVLEADSKNGASGLIKDTSVNICQFKYLNWSWMITKKLRDFKEEKKLNDDFAARIYVVIANRWFFWKTISICYVWSSRSTDDKSWKNPYEPKNVQMISLRSSKDEISKWYIEKRNVYKDFKKYFNIDCKNINAIGIMTDTDNTQTKEISYYGDIYFTNN
ncbi:MAG TPA: DUF3047 domain-containing protein [Victivallales bacterium]|nr:DUF3047 domain-containing protein [Victivallales bacterium]